MNLYPPALILLASILMISCTTMPGENAASTKFIAAQKEKALRLEEQGRLAQSLTVWRSVLPLGSDAEAKAAIQKLESRISSAVDRHLRAAKSAHDTGNSRQADDAMLRVLALQPGHKKALRHLRKSASARAQAHAHAQQNSKSAAKYAIASPPAKTTSRSATTKENVEQRMNALYKNGDYRGVVTLGESSGNKSATTQALTAQVLRKAHIKLADSAQHDGKSEQALKHLQAAMIAKPLAKDPLIDRSLALRAQLSKHWYQEGSRLMTNDLGKAMEALRQSLQYNPYNDHAKRKLVQAETLQRNLEKISNQR